MRLKLTGTLAFSIIVAGLLLVQPSMAWADDVTVKTITPDKPPTPAVKPDPNKVSPADPANQPPTQPDPTANPRPRRRQPWVNTGVSRVDGALGQVGLTEEQVTKITAALDPFKKQYQESTKELQERFMDTVKELTALSVQGAKVDREKWAEVQKRQQEASRKLSEAGEKFRPDMEAQLLPLLTAAQVAKYKDALEESSDTPTGRAKSRARWDLWQYRVAELTEQQQTQVRDILAKAYEEFDKSHPDYNDKVQKLSTQRS